MNCPCFKDSSIGLCDATKKLRAPSISEMDKYCFRSAYRYCPTYHKSGTATYARKYTMLRKGSGHTLVKCA